MSSTSIDYSALAKQYGATSSTPPPSQKGSVDYAALAKQYGATSSTPPPPPPDLTANPKGEGTYKMNGPGGQVGVPYSRVQTAQQHGYTVDGADSSRYQKDFGATQPGPLDRLAQWGAKTFPHLDAGDPAAAAAAAAGPHATGIPGVDRFMGNVVSRVGQDVTALPASVVDSVKNAFNSDTYLHGLRKGQERSAAAAASGAPVTAQQLTDYKPTVSDASDLAANVAADTGVAVGAGELGGMALRGVTPAIDAVKRIPDVPRRLLAGNVDAPIPGTDGITPRMRYNAAKRVGVQLAPADATNSTPLQIAKKYNENSLFGSGVYDDARGARVTALRNAGAADADAMSHAGDPDSQGMMVRAALQRDQAGLRDAATDGFQTLADSTGDGPVGGASSVGQQAQAILQREAPYFTKYPAYKPHAALSALEDLSKVGDTSSYPELQRLRSNTHELTTTNPDIVKDQSTAWLQQMVGTIDDAITAGLTPEQQAVFRDSNGKWADMKDTYDNSQNALYHAVRAPDTSVASLASKVGPQTAANAIDLLQRLGPDATGALRRGTFEQMLKPDTLGAPNFNRFSAQLHSVPAPYRAELFSPEQNMRLRDLNLTSDVMSKDLNPSGSAKLGQKVFEGTMMLPTLGAPLLQYPLAKLLNSSAFTEWLMKQPGEAGGVTPLLPGSTGSLAPTPAAPTQPTQRFNYPDPLTVTPAAADPVAGLNRLSGGSESDAISKIRDVFEASQRPGNVKKATAFAPVSDWLKNAGQDAGHDLDGYQHAIDADAIRHAMKNHGDAASEGERGQLGIKQSDFEQIPGIVSEPDRVIFGGKTKSGLDSISYIKRLEDGTVAYVDEKRTGKSTLSAVTLHKHPAAIDIDRLAANLQPNVRNDGGAASPIVIPGPNVGNSPLADGAPHPAVSASDALANLKRANAAARSYAASAPQMATADPLAGLQRIGGLDGSDTQVHTPGGVLPGKYKIVEADDLIPSHNAFNFRENPNYPTGVQERDYAGGRENQLRVIQNAQGYKPELTVNDNPDGVNGPPVVTPQGVVLGGNSRTMSTQRVYADNPDTYRGFLTKKAKAFGIDPASLAGMKKPMLVREVAGDSTDAMRKVGSDLNKSLMGSLGGSERAVSMGKGMSPQTLQAVQSMMDEAGNGATLRDVMSEPSKSNAFLQRMQADGVITSAERPQFVDTSTGGMTEEGKRMFERALLGASIGDSGLMDATPKNVMQKLNASIGPLSAVGARSDEWNILPQVRRALEEHSKMAASGMGVDDYLAQQPMFSKMDPETEQMTRLLGKNQNAVRDAFASYAADARQAPEGQHTFLGPTQQDAFEHAFGRTPQ